MARIREIRAMNDDQLRQQLDELNSELFNLRFQRAAYKNPSPARFGQIKKNIAQIKTILREREIEALIAEVEAASATA
ncbi:MAG: 50S ribosomal protein L29 [Chloroflexi bacterium]|nr:50S ribosomal protein L29 [Chloroflexota bacterium]OJW06010.1 MAG: 50S ribosomal protein L29 [Chloroflexi bacterium 54-19]